jgi:hypothetical protein
MWGKGFSGKPPVTSSVSGTEKQDTPSPAVLKREAKGVRKKLLNQPRE